MVSVKVASVAGALALFAPMAQAADMPGLPPVYPPQIEEYAAASGWYLRGDIGMTNQKMKNMHHARYDDPGTAVQQHDFGWDSSMFFGLGVGYKFNDWFRADLTGEYRGRSNLHGSDSVTFTGGSGVDNYSGSKSEWLVLANAYVDLGTWWCITPYVGAGIGTARVNIIGFRDDGFNYQPALAPASLNNSTYYADDASKWNFAWALHAGITYKVTQSMSIDFGYRYTDLGSGMTGGGRTFDNSVISSRPFTFNHITSHDLKLGVRWMLEPAPQVQPVSLPPLMRRG
jgi:opacity protein-like surface antigen